MSNIVIIGSGPAGVSAALYAARAGVQTTVLTKGPGALDRAELIQNYYGFAEPIAGAELERRGIEGAKAVGVEFVTTEAVGLTYTDKLTVETLAGDFPADAVILATGASRAAPRIPGLAGLEGRGVSYCATCDAFFYRGKDVAVVGSGEYALHEVQALLPVAASVTLLLNGAPPAAEFPPEVAVRPEKIDAILGDEYLMERSQCGVPPSVREIGAAVGLKSTSSVQANLDALEEAGYIERDPMLKRSIRVTGDAENVTNVPLLGTVTAGMPILAVEQIEGYLPYSGRVSRDKPLFALKVRGESMIWAGILSGDIVIVEKTPVAANGEIVVAMIDDEATVKRFYKENGHFRLQPENDAFKPIIVDEVIILGKVVGLMRYYD